jgi:glycerol-1-phosphate dehydrogenase [NAD(P)+]
LEDAQAEAAKMFEGTDFPTIGVTEVTAKYVDKDGLRRQLTTLRDNWVHISDRLNRQIIPLEEARKMLAAVGAPTEPEQIGISRERLRNSAIRAQKIRRRFTILDIAVRTGKLETWLNKIFG